MTNIKINTVAYDASAGAFRARVDLSRQGRNFRYPCEVEGPLNMNMNDVRSRLKQQALAMSDSGATLWSVA